MRKPDAADREPLGSRSDRDQLPGFSLNAGFSPEGTPRNVHGVRGHGRVGERSSDDAAATPRDPHVDSDQ